MLNRQGQNTKKRDKEIKNAGDEIANYKITKPLCSQAALGGANYMSEEICTRKQTNLAFKIKKLLFWGLGQLRKKWDSLPKMPLQHKGFFFVEAIGQLSNKSDLTV